MDCSQYSEKHLSLVSYKLKVTNSFFLKQELRFKEPDWIET